jgi:hypothetical protein
MRITAQQLVTLEISDGQAKEITVDFLCETFDWDRDFRILNGQVVKIFPTKSLKGLTHSLPPEYIRDASKEDEIVNNLFDILLDD